MALMFPRLARNFVKNGYFPTDEPTLERALNALMPSDGPMCILDPCAGEGVAIAEAAHALGREHAKPGESVGGLAKLHHQRVTGLLKEVVSQVVVPAAPDNLIDPLEPALDVGQLLGRLSVHHSSTASRRMSSSRDGFRPS